MVTTKSKCSDVLSNLYPVLIIEVVTWVNQWLFLANVLKVYKIGALARNRLISTQSEFTSSKLTAERLEKGVSQRSRSGVFIVNFNPF